MRDFTDTTPVQYPAEAATEVGAGDENTTDEKTGFALFLISASLVLALAAIFL